MKNNTNERYSRHLQLRGFGASGQQLLSDARVLVIGAGGLGCPVLQYLAAAGVGTLGIADHDIISLSNLQRQVLYPTADIGLAKATVAASKLKALNPELEINAYVTEINTGNALQMFRGYDIIVDGTDNFASRYLINDACVLLGKSLIYGAVYEYEGQVAVFNVINDGMKSVNYRHLFPDPPAPGEVPDCNVNGVLGVLPGTIGMLMATEVIKLITGIGEPLINRLFTYDLLTHQSYSVKIPFLPLPANVMPATESDFFKMDYDEFCNGPKLVHDISSQLFKEMMRHEDVVVIDVREPGEQPAVAINQINIPLTELAARAGNINSKTILLFCQSGSRSKKAAQILQACFGDERMIYSLAGGILNFESENQRYHEG